MMIEKSQLWFNMIDMRTWPKTLESVHKYFPDQLVCNCKKQQFDWIIVTMFPWRGLAIKSFLVGSTKWKQIEDNYKLLVQINK